jgi:hypothetical protein
MQTLGLGVSCLFYNLKVKFSISEFHLVFVYCFPPFHFHAILLHPQPTYLRFLFQICGVAEKDWWYISHTFPSLSS